MYLVQTVHNTILVTLKTGVRPEITWGRWELNCVLKVEHKISGGIEVGGEGQALPVEVDEGHMGRGWRWG